MRKKRGFLALGALGTVIFSGLLFVLNFNNNFGNIKNNNIIQTQEIEEDSLELKLARDDEIRNIEVSNGYESLDTDVERMVYKKVIENADNVSYSKTRNGSYYINDIYMPVRGVTLDVIKKVLYAIRNDHPNIFWISNFYERIYDDKSSKIRLSSIFSKKELAYAKEKMEDKTNEIISSMPRGLSDYDKVKFIHDYIVKNCKYAREQLQFKSQYDHNSLNRHGASGVVKSIPSYNISFNDYYKIFTPYGCLIDRSAVCEGISKAFQILCTEVGIETRQVSGYLGEEAHMWNLVKIDGDWYHIDVTNDKNQAFNEYTYFCLSDQKIQELGHKISRQIIDSKEIPQDSIYNFKLPECNSMKHNYYYKNSIHVSDFGSNTLRKITDRLYRIALNSNENYLYLMPANRMSLTTLKNTFLKNTDSLISRCLRSANSRLESYKQLQNISYVENKKLNLLMIKVTKSSNNLQEITTKQLIEIQDKNKYKNKYK